MNINLNPLVFFSKDIGIDLGTKNTQIYIKERGIVINEATMAAINSKTGQIIAIGNEAKKMLGRTPAHVEVVSPIVSGVISDFDIMLEILKYFLRQASGSVFFNYGRAVVGVPSSLTEVERKSVEDIVVSSGISRAYLIDETIAVALGARLPINEPTANMIVDIGAGKTEISIISMNGTVKVKNIKIAGNKLNEDIIRFIRDEFRLIIGEPTAEDLKVNIGSALPLEERLEMSVQGRDLATGLPKEILVKDVHIRTAIIRSLKTIVEGVREVLEIAPPELAGDILRRGIYLCGGGSMLKKLNELISRELLVSTFVVDDPTMCAVRGVGTVIENFSTFSHILAQPLLPKEIKV